MGVEEMEAKKYWLSATVHYMVCTVGSRGVAKSKKENKTKLGPVILDRSDHVRFLVSVLNLHDLGEHYAPSEASGFPFKIWWWGSP